LAGSDIGGESGVHSNGWHPASASAAGPWEPVRQWSLPAKPRRCHPFPVSSTVVYCRRI